MKLIEHFNAFMVDTVNLNQTRLDYLDRRVAAIVDCLREDHILGARVRKHIPQGSWAHRTIIKPVRREFDADVLLVLVEDRDWNKDPGTYIEETYRALRRSATYKGMVTLKSRCIRINYANECHVDVVPHIHLSHWWYGNRDVIVNRNTNQFEDANPDAFTKWMQRRDGTAHGHLRRVIRILKYLRDYKRTFSVPSVILTTLLGHRVNQLALLDPYPDLPTALKNLVSDVDEWLQDHPTKPHIDDPGCPQTNFDHRWDDDEYRNFCRMIHVYGRKVRAAYEERDKATSLVLWQQVFGEDFGAQCRARGTA